MTSAAYDIAYYCAQTLALGTLGTDIFCNYMPDSPDVCIAIFQYGGSRSLKGFGSDAHPLEHPSVQVDVRNSDPSVAETIHKAFDEIAVETTINSTVYTNFEPMQPPFLLERDADGRPTYVFNMEIQRRRT